jgi:hypothetical protein
MPVATLSPTTALLAGLRVGTPAVPKPVKPEKKERISKAHLDYLKSRAALHIRELVAEFFPAGHFGRSGEYWITPELRISMSTGCFWRNGSSSRRPAGDILTLWCIGSGLVVEEKIPEEQNSLEALKARLSNTGAFGFKELGAFQRGVQSFSEWLEQFPVRADLHSFVCYDS